MSVKIETELYQFFQNLGKKKTFRLGIAVSGGSDSMFALEVLATNQEKINVTYLHAIHVNHLLRGDDSDADEKLVNNQCLLKGVDFSLKRIDIQKLVKEKGKSLEVIAREERYAFFEEIFQKHQLDYIVTAHHLNDNVETSFFNFCRGSGVKGLAGIPEVRNKFIRPFLNISKQEILDYCQNYKIRYRDDKSNFSLDYSRNIIRNELLPIINKKLNRNVSKVIARNSQLFKDLDGFLSAYLEGLLNNNSLCRRFLSVIIINHNTFKKLDRFIKTALLQKCFQNLSGLTFPYERIRLILTDLERVKMINFSEHSLSVQLSGNSLIILKDKKLISSTLTKKNNVLISSPLLKLSLRKCNFSDFKKNFMGPKCFYLSADLDFSKLKIQANTAKEKFHKFGKNSTLSIAKLMSDQKIPLLFRSRMVGLKAGKDFVFIQGLGNSAELAVAEDKSSILTEIQIKFDILEYLF